MYNFLVSYSYSKIVLENSNIIFNSKSVCSFYQNYFNTVSFQPQIIPNFISEDDFSDFKLKTDYEIKNSYITVISTARLEYQKGLDTLLKSISNIKSIKIKVIILGEGSQKNNLIKLAKDLNIELFLPGVVKNIYSFISESDIYVQPSRFEGMPNGLMEAMLCGLPCIGSNIEGINELIDNNNSGLLFEKEKYQELSFLIEQLITNKQLREQLGQNARKKLLDDFNANKIIDIWLQNF
jgi:glycosyltransferase involved in cell wall biosynthesis